MTKLLAMPVLTRAVEERDIPALAAIRAREWESEAYWQNRIAGYLTAELSPQQALPERAAFVAVEGDTIVGFAAGHRTRRFDCDGELEWVNVVPEHRGRGIGGQLLKCMALWFEEQGITRVCVDVVPENITARKLYTRRGAQTLNKHWMVWENVASMKPPS